MRLTNPLTAISAVVTGGSVNIDCPREQRYHDITLRPTVAGVAVDPATFFSNIRATIGGAVMLDLTPAQITAIATLYGYAPAALGELPLIFSDPSRRTPTGEEATSWPTYGVSKFSLDCDILGGIVGVLGLTAQSSTDKARNITQAPDGKISEFVQAIKRTRTNEQVAVGENHLTRLPLNLPFKAIHLFAPAGTVIESVQVKADDVIVHDDTIAGNLRTLAKNGFAVGGTIPSYPICFDMDRQASSFLQVNRYLDILVRASGAGGNVAVVMERVSPTYS